MWSDANLATALGGITKGVTNVELCAAYAAIANNGNYIKPIYYTRILDHNGNVLIDNTSVPRSVIKESTAWLLTSAMEDVIDHGTGTACRLEKMPAAGKTGTTEAYNDLWFVGYTPYYTCAVWSGYDNNEKLPTAARDFHKNLWTRVMNRIHEDLPVKTFEMPASIQEATVCKETGLLAADYCDTVTEFFDISTIPTETCEEHVYSGWDWDYDEDTTDYTEDTTQSVTYSDNVIMEDTTENTSPDHVPENTDTWTIDNDSFTENWDDQDVETLEEFNWEEDNYAVEDVIYDE